MSIRGYLYWSALAGAWGCIVGWILAKIASPQNDLGASLFQDMFASLLASVALVLVDVAWRGKFHRPLDVLPRVGVGGVLGLLGGLIGSLVASALHSLTQGQMFRAVGWAAAGAFIGAGVRAGEIMTEVFRLDHDIRAALARTTRSTLAGAGAGLAGGFVLVAWESTISVFLFSGKDLDSLISPGIIGFASLGACLGLLVSLAAVILNNGWLTAATGPQAGRQRTIEKTRFVIGLGEACDWELPGAVSLQGKCAAFTRIGNQCWLDGAGGIAELKHNGERVTGRTPLQSGDEIAIGESVLIFRQPRTSAGAERASPSPGDEESASRSAKAAQRGPGRRNIDHLR